MGNVLSLPVAPDRGVAANQQQDVVALWVRCAATAGAAVVVASSPHVPAWLLQLDPSALAEANICMPAMNVFMPAEDNLVLEGNTDQRVTIWLQGGKEQKHDVLHHQLSEHLSLMVAIRNPVLRHDAMTKFLESFDAKYGKRFQMQKDLSEAQLSSIVTKQENGRKMLVFKSTEDGAEIGEAGSGKDAAKYVLDSVETSKGDTNFVISYLEENVVAKIVVEKMRGTLAEWHTKYPNMMALFAGIGRSTSAACLPVPSRDVLLELLGSPETRIEEVCRGALILLYQLSTNPSRMTRCATTPLEALQSVERKLQRWNDKELMFFFRLAAHDMAPPISSPTPGAEEAAGSQSMVTHGDPFVRIAQTLPNVSRRNSVHPASNDEPPRTHTPEVNESPPPPLPSPSGPNLQSTSAHGTERVMIDPQRIVGNTSTMGRTASPMRHKTTTNGRSTGATNNTHQSRRRRETAERSQQNTVAHAEAGTTSLSRKTTVTVHGADKIRRSSTPTTQVPGNFVTRL